MRLDVKQNRISYDDFSLERLMDVNLDSNMLSEEDMMKYCSIDLVQIMAEKCEKAFMKSQVIWKFYVEDSVRFRAVNSEADDYITSNIYVIEIKVIEFSKTYKEKNELSQFIIDSYPYADTLETFFIYPNNKIKRKAALNDLLERFIEGVEAKKKELVVKRK